MNRERTIRLKYWPRLVDEFGVDDSEKHTYVLSDCKLSRATYDSLIPLNEQGFKVTPIGNDMWHVVPAEFPIEIQFFISSGVIAEFISVNRNRFVKIKTYDSMRVQFGLAFSSFTDKKTNIECQGGFSLELDALLPDNRIIEVTPSFGSKFSSECWVWNSNERTHGKKGCHSITDNMIEEDLTENCDGLMTAEYKDASGTDYSLEEYPYNETDYSTLLLKIGNQQIHLNKENIDELLARLKYFEEHGDLEHRPYINNKVKTLAQVMPADFPNVDALYRKYADVEVVAVHRKEDPKEIAKPWIGKHKHVTVWAELKNGYAVAANQAPGKWMTFPCEKIKDVVTLKSVMPMEFMSGGFRGTQAYGFRMVEVIARHDSSSWPWKGAHKKVSYWVELRNGYAVAVNQNKHGWSFPVRQMS